MCDSLATFNFNPGMLVTFLGLFGYIIRHIRNLRDIRNGDYLFRVIRLEEGYAELLVVLGLAGLLVLLGF